MTARLQHHDVSGPGLDGITVILIAVIDVAPDPTLSDVQYLVRAADGAFVVAVGGDRGRLPGLELSESDGEPITIAPGCGAVTVEDDGQRAAVTVLDGLYCLSSQIQPPSSWYHSMVCRSPSSNDVVGS